MVIKEIVSPFKRGNIQFQRIIPIQKSPQNENLELKEVKEVVRNYLRRYLRSIMITVINLTDSALNVGTFSIHGHWGNKPPASIPPLHSAVISAHAEFDIKGNLSYYIYGEFVLLFEWKIPFFGSCTFNSTGPPQYSIVTHTEEEGRHSSVEISIKSRNFSDPYSTEYINHLQRASNFDKDEIKEFHNDFYTAIAPQKSITKEIFLKFFPQFLGHEEVLNSIFSAFDDFHLQDQLIDFEEYVRVLSVMSRGNMDQKLNLAFRICDLNRNNYVEKNEVLKICYLVVQVLESISQELRKNYGDPNEVVENIFMKNMSPEERPIKGKAGAISIPSTSLSKEDFIIRARDEPDFAEGFGLFPFFYYTLVKPIEDKVRAEMGFPAISGWARQDKGNKFLKFIKPTEERFFKIDQGFISYKKRKEQKKTRRAISLSYALIKEVQEHLDVQTVSWSRRIYFKDKKEMEIFLHVLRENARGGFRFQSFAPIRRHINGKFFNNGKEYFASLIPTLNQAKKVIFIADWWLCPGILLDRNVPHKKENRLDHILRKKAKEGVKIYILIWNALNMAMDLHSKVVELQMNTLHKNIHCIRHPPFRETVRWTHHQKFVVIDEEIAFIGGIDLCYGRYETREYPITDQESTNFPGRDYNNLSYFAESYGDPSAEYVDRNFFPRMPWHDVMIQVAGLAARDIGLNFIQRWNFVNLSLGKKRHYILPSKEERTSEAITLHREGYSNLTCQILRSLSNWSGGIPIPERSIYRAYLSAIQNAEHFIYLENQYFITSIEGTEPKNKILRALYERIHEAIVKNQNFRVIVMLPAYPAGLLKDPATLYLIKLHFQAISREGNSILERLHEDFPEVDLSKYISFHSLRNWGVLNGATVTSHIYIHSKMCIIDDRIAIIGSANINDRSMRGTRDSEIAAIIEQDQGLVESMMDGKPYQVSSFVHDFRKKIWRNFLGLDSTDESIQDPVADEVFHGIWQLTSVHNTQIYKSVFKKVPEKIYKLSDLNQEEAPVNTQRLNELKGYLTDFPMDLLKDEPDLTPPITSKERLLPKNIFF